MGLRQTAEQDLSMILSDALGFSGSIQVTNPYGLSKPLTGFSNDISQLIDPDTGLFVTGRTASIALSMSALTLAGFTSIPEGITDTSKKPWIVDFNDINGNAYKFKIAESSPDRALGIVTCLLSTYKV